MIWIFKWNTFRSHWKLDMLMTKWWEIGSLYMVRNRLIWDVIVPVIKERTVPNMPLELVQGITVRPVFCPMARLSIFVSPYSVKKNPETWGKKPSSIKVWEKESTGVHSWCSTGPRDWILKNLKMWTIS